MKEIGGYFSLECGSTANYHKKAIGLNSCRNALRYVIRTYNITEMYVPIYTCPVVWDAISAENCKIISYDIDDDFLPACDIPENAFVLYNNYFGINGENVKNMAQRHKNLIVDNAQGFYQPHCGLASIYSPRKFFGLPDGGLVVCDKVLSDELDTSMSYDKCMHLLKRIDLGANAGYTDFQANDESLIGQPIKKISKLTSALMGNIDYEKVKKQRLKNFAVLHNTLADKNEMNINLSSVDVPLVYPFKIKDKNLRVKLIQNQIFVAKYWPSEENGCMKSPVAQTLAATITALPIDQRYDESDMQRILEVING